MEGDLIDLLENREQRSTSNDITLAIVGVEGTGKSALGNNILGRQAFISYFSPSRITYVSELKSGILEDGRVVNIIDTPGLFDFPGTVPADKEIVKCIDLAKDGIHAVLMVFTMQKRRFTLQDKDSIQSMKALFGERIVDYMIVVFTCEDLIEIPFKEYFRDFPEGLKSFIRSCKNRVIVFDNITEDKIKKEAQMKQLISLVDSVITSNGGIPLKSTCSNEWLTSTIKKLEKQLMEEKAALLKIEMLQKHQD